MNAAYLNAAVAFVILMSMIIAGVWVNNKRLNIRREEIRLGAGDGEMRREVMTLTGENSELKDQVSYLEERIAVLERIATDPSERTAREIERLR